jgi:RNA polymerase sigma factor (sigma-70 family)
MRLFRTLRDHGETRVDPERIAAEIGALDSRQSEAMRLYYLEHMTQARAAKQMGVSQAAVAKLLEKGRRALWVQLTC